MIRPFLAPALFLYCILTLISSGPEKRNLLPAAEVDFSFSGFRSAGASFCFTSSAGWR